MPTPIPGPFEVLIDIRVAGVNRTDLLARAGHHHRDGSPPLVLGPKASGVVYRLGSAKSSNADPAAAAL